MKIEVSSSSSPASANSGDKGRVCICCWCDSCYYSFYVLDFDEDINNTTEFIEKSPDFRIDDDSLRKVLVCVTDPYAYVIGAVGEVDLLWESGEFWVSRFDLRRCSPSESTTVEIGPTELEKGRVTAMKKRKFYPGITASPDGSRVVVYSRFIDSSVDREEYYENHDVDFEVFDTQSQNWSQLPQLIICMPGYMSFSIKRSNSDDWIDGCGGHLSRKRPSLNILDRWYLQITDGKFINGNTLLVTLDVGLIFTLNLDSPEEGWKHYGDEHIPHVQLDQFALAEPEPSVVVTPSEVKVVRSKGKVVEEEFTHRFPLSTELSHIQTAFSSPDVVVSVLRYVENEECVACIVTNGVDVRTCHALLVFDLFKLDLVPRNGNDYRPAHLGSYKYLLNKSSSYFSVDSMVPFSKSIESQKRQKLAHGTSATATATAS